MTAAASPLRYRNVRLLAGARLVDYLGTAIAPIALSFAVLDITHGSVSALGVVVGARSALNAIFLLVGGVVADRFPRYAVLVVSSVLSALTQGAVAAVVLSHTATVPLLAVLGGVNGIVTAFALPASAAMTPQTVPPELRQRATAMLRMAQSGAMMGGAALGGILVAVVGPGIGLAVDAASFLLVTVLFALVRVPDVRRAGPAAHPVAELVDGWREFTSRAWVWIVVLGFMLLNAALVAGTQVLGPQVADETFGRAGWGFFLAASTFGFVVGGLVAMRLKVRRFLFLGTAAMGLLALEPLTLAAWPLLPVLMAVGFVAGIGVEQFGVAWEVSLQQHIPPDRLARVYSYDMLGSFVAIPLGQVAIGPVAAAVGIRPALYGCAAVIALATLGMLASRQVRRLQNRPAAVTMATALDAEDAVSGVPR